MIRIVTDTTAGLSREVLRAREIDLVPQIVIFGEQAYRDDTEIDTPTFIQKLKASAALPKTSAPPPSVYDPIFEDAAQKGQTVLCLHPSAKISGTVRSALTATQEFNARVDIRVVDTLTVAGNLATLVLLADEWIKRGYNIERVIKDLNALIPKQRTYFLVDTLEYLRKGGRIGGAKALLGELLQVKPILCLKDGQVEPFDQERTKKHAMPRLIEIAAEQAAPGTHAHICVMHSEAPADAQYLAGEIKTRLNLIHVPIYELPPAIIVHTGPGALGIGFFTG
jgi:DegV family protein with EDD domain